MEYCLRTRRIPLNSTPGPHRQALWGSSQLDHSLASERVWTCWHILFVCVELYAEDSTLGIFLPDSLLRNKTLHSAVRVSTIKQPLRIIRSRIQETVNHEVPPPFHRFPSRDDITFCISFLLSDLVRALDLASKVE